MSLSFAQDSRRQESKSIVPGLRHRLNASTTKVNQSAASLKHKLSSDTLKFPTDSLKLSKWSVQIEKGDSIQRLLKDENRLTFTPDSVIKATIKPITKVKARADSLKQKADAYSQEKLSSVEQKINKPLDKVNSKISSTEKPIEQKVEHVNQAIDQKTGKLQTGIQKGFDKATDGTVKAPMEGLQTNGLNLPSKPESISGVDISSPNPPGLNSDLPGINVSKVSPKIPDAKLNADHLREEANLTIPEMDKVNEAKGELGKLGSNLNEVEKYGKELQGLKNLDSATIENASKKAEEKIMKLDQLEGVQEQTQVFTKQQAEHKALIQKYNDKKLLQEEMRRKAKSMVNDKFTHNTPEIKKAMNELTKHKKSVKEILDKKNNTMADKPVTQRLVPGITLQWYKKPEFEMDFAMQVGYQTAGRLRTGIGGIYRVRFDKKYDLFIKGANIFGGRMYSDFIINRGIYAHAEYEILRGRYIGIRATGEGVETVTHAYFGIGKQFNISKKIKGHSMVLYRTEFTGKLFDESKIHLRLGFDLRTDKKRRQSTAAAKP